MNIKHKGNKIIMSLSKGSDKDNTKCCQHIDSVKSDASVKHILSLSELWKESLNSDGHRFHQYQKNEQSPLILAEHKKDHDIYDIEHSGPGLGQAQKCGGLNLLMGSQSSPLDNWISKVNTFIINTYWSLREFVILKLILETGGDRQRISHSLHVKDN